MAETKPKHVLIFSFVYYPRYIGGAEVAVKEITDRISVSEIEFDLIALRIDKNLPKFERIGNVNVHRVGFVGSQKQSSDSLPWYLHVNKYLYPFFSRAKAKALQKTRDYSATWAIMANYSGFGALFFKSARPDIPFILTLQEGDPIDYIKKRVRFVYPLFKKIFADADIIQTISNYLADFAREMGGKNIVVVPNGVDVVKFSAEISQSEISAVKEVIGKKQDDIFLVTASRLVVKNAVSDIVKALKFLPENVKLLVCGTGYEEKNLRALVEKLSLGGRVVFKGFVSQNDLPKYLRACEVFVRPSLSEGFGNSFIEAMAARIPVVATSVGGIVDFLEDKKTGLFCAVSEPKDLAKKVEIYMRDVFLREEIIDNAFEMVKEKYDWNLVASDMREKVFQKILL